MGFNSIKHLQTKSTFSLIMRKKVQPRKQEPLRKHGAETGSQQRTQPPPRESTQSPSGIRRKVILTNLSQDTPAGTSQRTQTGHSDSRSDKTYEGYIDKSRKTLQDTQDDDGNSDDHSRSSNSTSTEYSTSASESDPEELEPPSSKRIRLTSAQEDHHFKGGPSMAVFPGMTMPEYTIDKDIKHFIDEMTTFLEFHPNLQSSSLAKLVRAGVKGEAKDVLMGYATTDLDTPDKIFNILKRDFGKREKSARHLHQLKQETTEKVSIFAGHIRRYVKNMAVSKY